MSTISDHYAAAAALDAFARAMRTVLTKAPAMPLGPPDTVPRWPAPVPVSITGASVNVFAHGVNGTDRRYNTRVVNDAAANFSVLSIDLATDAEGFVTAIYARDKPYADVAKLE